MKKNQLDLLASWNDGEAKRNIIEFVEAVIDQTGPDYVPAAARIAVFDNDGTLWCEQPLYIQLAFAFDRVRALAPEHPEWRDDAAISERCSRTTAQALAQPA